MPVTPVPKIFWPLQGLNACGTYTYTQTLIYTKEKLQRGRKYNQELKKGGLPVHW